MADPILLLVRLILPFLGGMYCVYVWRRGRREGDTPRCPKCDYNLTGLPLERCPECGASLSAREIPRGELKRDRRLLLGVVLLCGWPLLLLCSILVTGKWYDYYPFGWICQDANSNSASQSSRGWAELSRRYDVEKLSIAQQAQLETFCVEYLRTATPPGTHDAWRLLHEKASKDYLAEQTRNELFDVCVQHLGLAAPPAPREAWGVIKALEQHGRLSNEQRSRLVALCLNRQVLDHAQGWSRALVDYLGECYPAGQLSPTEQERMFRQMATCDLAVRESVVAGDPVPFRLVWRGRVPRGFEVRFSPLEQSDAYGLLLPHLDGKPVKLTIPRESDEPISRDVGTPLDSHESELPCDAVGRHVIELNLGVFVFWEGTRLCQKQELRLRADFEVLEDEPPGYMRLISDPALKPGLVKSIRCDQVRTNVGERPSLFATLTIENPPVGVAFEVFVRLGGAEYAIGDIQVAKGSTVTKHLMVQTRFPAAQSCDLILRSSEDLACRTVDLSEIWSGDIECKGIPVSIAATASRPKPQ